MGIAVDADGVFALTGRRGGRDKLMATGALGGKGESEVGFRGGPPKKLFRRAGFLALGELVRRSGGENCDSIPRGG